MRVRSLMTALLGFAVAGGSVIMANQYLAERSRASMVAQAADMVSIVVAATDIGFGQEIASNLVTTQTWPIDALPQGAFTDLQDVLPPMGGASRRAKRPLAAGEILLKSKISEFGEKVTIVQTLAENSRAVAIQVDDVTGVAGFVTPGDRVDIIMTQGDRQGGLTAVTILQNIRVVAVDQVADEMRDKPDVARTVTVEVTPDESQKLALAQKAGQLSLTLRTAANSAPDKPLEMTRLDDLLVEKSPASAEVRQPKILIRRGNAVENVSVD